MAPHTLGVVASKSGTRPSYRCTECGWPAVKWVGRCGECQAWGTVAEVGAPAAARTNAVAPARPAVPISEVDAEQAQARSTGVEEFDRVLGGGIVPGAVVRTAAGAPTSARVPQAWHSPHRPTHFTAVQPHSVHR